MGEETFGFEADNELFIDPDQRWVNFYIVGGIAEKLRKMSTTRRK